MHIDTIGGLRVDGQPVRGARLAAVVKALIDARGRAVSTAALIDAVWAEEPPEDATGAVQALISRVRRLGLPVLAAPAGYLLPADAVELDVLLVRRLVDLARLQLHDRQPDEALRSAVRARAYFPAVPELGADDELTRLFGELATVRAEAALAVIDAESGEADLRLLTAHRPPHEPAVALLVRVLAAQGRDAEALAVIERLREELADTYGADPSRVVTETQVALLRGELAPVPAARTEPAHRAKARPVPVLPPAWRRAVTPLVGRAADVEAVLAALQDAPLVTVVAVGGAGKTRLAAEVVRGFAGPVHVVELAGLREDAEVLPAVLAAVGAGEALPERTSAGRLRLAVHDMHGLVVLDNCEHVLEGAAGTAADLIAESSLAVLATSRAPLSLPGEVVHRLRALPDEAALELLQARVAAGGGALERDAAQALELCHRLDNLPLALELAAARLRHMPIGDVLTGLSDRFGLLDAALRGLPDRHASLWAMVDWSRELLAEADRTLLARLSVIPAPFTAELAQAVLDGRDVRHGLATLVEQSLLTLQHGGDSRPRYRMLETVREYGEVRLGSRDEAMAGLVRWARAASAEVFAEIIGPDQLVAFGRAAADQDNLVAALRWALAAGDDAAAVEVFAPLAHLWTVRGLHPEVVTWAKLLFKVDDPVARRRPGLLDADPARAAWACLLAGLNGAIGNSRRLFGIALRALRRLEQSRRGEVPARVLVLASAVRALTSPDLNLGLRAAERLSAEPDRYVRACGFFFKAVIHENQGALDQSKRDAETAYREFEAAGDHWGMGMTAQSLGSHGGVEGHDWLRRSEKHWELLGAIDDLGSIRIQLDSQLAMTGDEAALERLRVAAENVQGLDAGLANLALAQAGPREEALDRAARALELADTLPAGSPPQARVMFRSALAVLYMRFDRAHDAAVLLGHALEDARLSQDMPVLGSWALSGASLASHRGLAEPAGELWVLGLRLGGNPRQLFPHGVGAPPEAEDVWKWRERPMTEVTDRVRELMSDLLAVGEQR